MDEVSQPIGQKYLHLFLYQLKILTVSQTSKTHAWCTILQIHIEFHICIIHRVLTEYSYADLTSFYFTGRNK